MITKYNELHADLEQNEKLDSFLSAMSHFNKEVPLEQSMVDDIRRLFNYRW